MALEVTDLHGGYEIGILHGVNLQVRAGQVTVLLGANGAGKTTLLKCLSGTARVTSGALSLFGTDLTASPPHRRPALGLSHVPQGRRIFASLSVEENIRVGLCGLRLTRKDARARIEECYELFPDLAGIRAKQGLLLSGGQQQMLAVARGLVSHPRVLLLDEPSVGLAPSVVQDMFARFDQVRSGGRTSILLVEQRVKEATELADSVYVMRNGRTVVEAASPDTITNEQLTAAYL